MTSRRPLAASAIAAVTRSNTLVRLSIPPPIFTTVWTPPRCFRGVTSAPRAVRAGRRAGAPPRPRGHAGTRAEALREIRDAQPGAPRRRRRDEGAEPRHHGARDTRVTASHAFDRRAHPTDLRIGERARDRVDRLLVEELPVGADDAGEPLARELPRRGSPVRGRHRVVLGCEISQPEVHVACERESLG